MAFSEGKGKKKGEMRTDRFETCLDERKQGWK